MTNPKYLYKYRPFGEFLLTELTNQEVYFCNPQQFNDPLDCKPLLSIDVDLNVLERLVYNLLKKKRPDTTEWAVLQMNEYRYGASEFGKYNDGKEGEWYYKRYLLNVIEDNLLEAMGDIGVLSLSRRWNSMLMWSHYANNHKGVCLEFAFEDNRCKQLKPVDYTSERGISVKDLGRWLLRGDAEAERRVRDRFVFSKSRDWKYEAEWRAIQSPSGSSPSPFHLRSIHFGARCDSSIVTTIVKLFSGGEIVPTFYNVYLDNEGARLRRTYVDTSYIEAFGVRKSAIFRDEEIAAHFEPIGEDFEEEAEATPPEQTSSE